MYLCMHCMHLNTLIITMTIHIPCRIADTDKNCAAREFKESVAVAL